MNIRTIIIALLCLFLLALEFYQKPQQELDITTHRAHCKMKIAVTRLQQFQGDIMQIARRVTALEIDYRVHVREAQAAPAFLPAAKNANTREEYVFLSDPSRPSRLRSF